VILVAVVKVLQMLEPHIIITILTKMDGTWMLWVLIVLHGMPISLWHGVGNTAGLPFVDRLDPVDRLPVASAWG
jgi:hypothetical protein